MKNLPADFVQLMIQHHGDAVTESLCSALLDTEPEVSVRLNTRKIEAHESLREMVQDILPSIGEVVSWCPDAYYLTERPAFTFDPLFHAGVYYVQEASSMYVAHLLSQYGPSAPSAALDLCAAPGGKSTLLAGLLPEGSLLLSNEPMPKRANILAENMQKWTRMSAGEYPVASLVANNYPADFGAFTDCFDVLVTDVPCSGEGMFRKDDEARAEWSEQNVRLCAERQDEILRHAWQALKAGGTLIYSTCTFNREEDEGSLERFLDWASEEVEEAPMVAVDGAWGVVTGHVGAFQTFRFFPHKAEGEGFFAAVARKSAEVRIVEDTPPIEIPNKNTSG